MDAAPCPRRVRGPPPAANSMELSASRDRIDSERVMWYFCYSSLWILEGRGKERTHLPMACGPVASASNTGRWAMANDGPPPVDCLTVSLDLLDKFTEGCILKKIGSLFLHNKFKYHVIFL